MRARPLVLLAAAAAAAGFLFAAYSTYDFVQHLDRQVHGIHCSFIPGLGGTDASGTTGCHVTLMSPYSSVFRKAVWGGIPISLPAMGVFAWLLFRTLDVVINRREGDRSLLGFLSLGAALPFCTSVVMGYLSLVELDAACKLCIGIYSASTVGLLALLGAWIVTPKPTGEEDEAPQSLLSDHVRAFLGGVAFVVLPIVLYAGVVPDYDGYIGTCGELVKAEDPYGVMVAMDPNPGATPAIEVLDPLCPSCRAFEHRLKASGLDGQLDRKAVMFPLDNTCNWMVGSALHPGACAISEAVVCAGERAEAVIDWAFQHQDEIKAAAAADPTAATRMAEAQFPDLADCIGSKQAQSKLNKSLRWAVANKLPVLTPQIYVGGAKLCDEDTDLGMDYALSRLIDRQKGAGAAARRGGL